MKSTQEVLDHHLQAFGEGLESILSDYDERLVISKYIDSIQEIAI